MANHKSAEKRLRQSLKRRTRNRFARSTVRTAVAKVKNSVQSGDLEAAKSQVKEAEKLLARAAGKGVIHKKNASRKISRLHSLISGKRSSTQLSSSAK
ncbi:MAG: 30S ribosomal protein S20 [Bdellovibrionales bacterium]|nr:30S ribosomal protein S20 [Bdellovibrionales bacterium]